MSMSKFKKTCIVGALLVSFNTVAQQAPTVDTYDTIYTSNLGESIAADVGALSNNGSDVHGNMHNATNASIEYTNWKADRAGSDDPFRRIAEGYKIEKDFEKDQYVETTYKPFVDSFIALSIQNKETNIQDRKGFRDDTITEIYESSFADNELDAETYSAEYDLYLEQKSTRSVMYYELRQSEIARAGIDSHANNQSQNTFTGNRSHTATTNLLGIISADIAAQKTLIRDAFIDNYEAVNTSNAFGSDALTLANNFSGDCPACNLPVPDVTPIADPVEPEPTPPPVYRPPIDDCFEGRWGGGNWRDPRHFYKCP